MDIEWARDLVICISGVVATGVLIFIAVLGYLLYHRTRSALDSVEAISNRASSVMDSIEGVSTTIEEIATYVGEEVVKPVIQIASLVQGVRQGIDTISSLFKKQEEKKDG